MTDKEKCEGCAELKAEKLAIELQKDAAISDVLALRKEIEAKDATLEARAKDLAQAKDRNREVVKARNEAIANRDDALAETRKWQDKCKALQDELAEAKKEGGNA